MAKSGSKFKYGIDEPGKLTKKKFDDLGYILVRKARNGKKAILADEYNGKFIWDYEPHIEFYEHPVEDILKFFKKHGDTWLGGVETEIKFLEIEVKKLFYKDILDDKK